MGPADRQRGHHGAPPRRLGGATAPALLLFEAFALASLVLAAAGLYGVMATRSLVALLFGVSSLDPATYLGVVALLGTVAMFACGVPAWRAAQVDPATPLRAEFQEPLVSVAVGGTLRRPLRGNRLAVPFYRAPASSAAAGSRCRASDGGSLSRLCAADGAEHPA